MKKILLITVLALSISCNNSSVEKVNLEKVNLENLNQESSSITPTPEEELLNVNEFMVYSVTLRNIVYNENFDDESQSPEHSRIEGNWMFVKSKTIIPENLEAIKTKFEMPEDLLNDFIENNKTPKKLRETGYDVKFGVEIGEIKGSVESFFDFRRQEEKIKRSNSIIKGVVRLSNIGFNKNHSQSLVYVEFYNPKTKLLKKYCLINWKKDGIGIRADNVKWL